MSFKQKHCYKCNKIQASLQDSLIGRNLHAYPQIYVSVSCFSYKSNSISISIQISFSNQSVDFDHSFSLETILCFGFCFFISSSDYNCPSEEDKQHGRIGTEVGNICM